MKKYSSPNGYTGYCSKGNFMGFKHWDFTIVDKEGDMVFHATRTADMTLDELKEQVDSFPEFRDMLSRRKK